MNDAPGVKTPFSGSLILIVSRAASVAGIEAAPIYDWNDNI
jgi:hypothetical protein